MKYSILYIAFTLFLALPFQLLAQDSVQDRYRNIENQLILLAGDTPGLEQTVELSVSGVPLAEFIRALGKTNKVNISVDAGVQGQVVNNFSDVSVADVLLFLVKEYNLDLKFSGSIIHVVPYSAPPPPPVVKIPKTLLISYDQAQDALSMELKQDSLPKVVKTLTRESGRNIVYAPGLENTLLSIYLENVQFDQAMDKMAFANNLRISKTEDGFYLIEKPQTQASASSDKNLRFMDLGSMEDKPRFEIDSNLINLSVVNRPISEVLENIFREIKVNYYFYSQVQGEVTLDVVGVTINELLQRLFAGTEYTYRVRDNAYLVGERKMEGLRETKSISLYHRAVEKVADFIPQDIRKDLEIKEFSELNSLLVSGSYPQIVELEKFIESIDKPVPVVIIEVMIVDYNRTNAISSGIEAGIGDAPVQSGGKVYPGVDYTLGAESINKLIASFDGFGALNLGPVTPNFYLSLQLLETNGVLSVKSTPKLSTLNGHEANISIGNTEYYVVEQTNVTGVQNPIPITTRNYQSVQANFTLTIKPMVSADGQVTLEIDVQQSDFTARISPEAPPGSVSRQFTSLIRVKDGEMILLGGLEEKSRDETGSGVPFLSRIPVIKWFFSSRSRTASKSKLNVFIKPTIIY